MTGPVEEAVHIAGGVVEALKSTPMTLAMILTNIMLLIFLFYSQTQFFNQRQELSKYFLESEREVREILSKCIVPRREGALEKPQVVGEYGKPAPVEMEPLKPLPTEEPEK